MTTDTSAEAVERLAAWHDNEAAAWRADGADNGLARIHDLHAATLRALLAERDALIARVADLSTTCGHCGTLEQAWAERDAARAAALEEAAQVAEDLISRAYNAGFSEGMRECTSTRGGIPWSDSVMKRRGAAAIRALAKEPPR